MKLKIENGFLWDDCVKNAKKAKLKQREAPTKVTLGEEARSATQPGVGTPPRDSARKGATEGAMDLPYLNYWSITDKEKIMLAFLNLRFSCLNIFSRIKALV